MEMVDPALTELDRMLRAPGTSDGDRTRIALAILDRTGYGKSMTVEHELKPWEIMMEHIFVPGAISGIERTPPLELEAEIVVSATEATFPDDRDEDEQHIAPVVYLPRLVDPGTPDSTRPR